MSGNWPLSAFEKKKDILDRIIAAAMQALTHNHQRMWGFVVLWEREEKENALQFVKTFAARQDENRMVDQTCLFPRDPGI